MSDQSVFIEKDSDLQVSVKCSASTEHEMFVMADFVSVDTLDVELLSPFTTNNNLTAVSNVSKVSKVNEKVYVDSIPSGATTPIETGCVSGYSVPSSLRSRKLISFEEETKVDLVEKRRLSLEEMERYSERDRLRAEEDRLLEQERQRQEELEQNLAH